MDVDSPILQHDNVETKLSFRKPSNDASGRKYRRRSSFSDTPSSSSDGSPIRGRSRTPPISREEHKRPLEDGCKRVHDKKYLETDLSHGLPPKTHDTHNRRKSHSASHDYHYHEGSQDYKRSEEEDRNYKRLSSRSERESRSRDYCDYPKYESAYERCRQRRQSKERYSLGRCEGGNPKSRDRERDDVDVERDKYRDKHGYDDKRDKGKDVDASKGSHPISYDDFDNLKGSSPGRNSHGGLLKDTRRAYDKEADRMKAKRRQDDKEWNSYREKYGRETERHRSSSHRASENRFEEKEQLSPSRKMKNITSTEDKLMRPDVKLQVGSSTAQENVNSLSAAQVQASDSDANAAKVAAMRAAELVNRNLIGTGCLSTDQKKKLLWGNKKNTSNEESGSRWEMTMFPDRERQEKFNKLMSLRLPWYIWPIVGCERRCQAGAQAGGTGCGEAATAAVGFRETVYCRPSQKGWKDCWLGVVIILRISFFALVRTVLLDSCVFNLFCHMPHAYFVNACESVICICTFYGHCVHCKVDGSCWMITCSLIDDLLEACTGDLRVFLLICFRSCDSANNCDAEGRPLLEHFELDVD